MDLSVYVEAIMQKLDQSNYYSEIEESELKYNIQTYLMNEYNEKVALLQLEIDAENSQGRTKDTEFYRKKLTDIKSHMIFLTREVGKISKD